MIEIDLPIGGADVANNVEACAANLSLTARRFTLAKYPGSTHWHLKKPGASGTLECTWWPGKNRLWLAVHSNRAADWHEEAIQAFQRDFR